MVTNYTNPFSICFTMMKLRYADYDKSISDALFLNSNDKVNVFINFESVLNNLSMVKDLDSKLLLERNFPLILESEMLNLCAHYKRFFKGNGLDTNIYLYYTDLKTVEFENFKYNDEYRSYYINKYLSNPKFQLLGSKLIERIIPRVKKIIEFIPNVYFIEGKGVEGSLIPLIISNKYPDRKNFIITADKYETQYLLNEKFRVNYIKRSPMGTAVYDSFNNYMVSLLNETFEGGNYDINLFTNNSFYATLISALGDKMRSIDPLKGVGAKTVMKSIVTGVSKGVVTKDTSSFDIIKNIFSDELQSRAEINFNCVDLDSQYSSLTDQHLFDITSQIVDRSDNNSLMLLNKTDYLNYPLMLPELTC